MVPTPLSSSAPFLVSKNRALGARKARPRLELRKPRRGNFESRLAQAGAGELGRGGSGGRGGGGVGEGGRF